MPRLTRTHSYVLVPVLLIAVAVVVALVLAKRIGADEAATSTVQAPLDATPDHA